MLARLQAAGSKGHEDVAKQLVHSHNLGESVADWDNTALKTKQHWCFTEIEGTNWNGMAREWKHGSLGQWIMSAYF